MNVLAQLAALMVPTGRGHRGPRLASTQAIHDHEFVKQSGSRYDQVERARKRKQKDKRPTPRRY